jgi:hypothetical protein
MTIGASAVLNLPSIDALYAIQSILAGITLHGHSILGYQLIADPTQNHILDVVDFFDILYPVLSKQRFFHLFDLLCL